jgi:hypothetical protein
MKNVALMLVIAIAAAAFTPRDRQEASMLAMRLGVALVKLAVALSPPWVYDGSVYDDEKEEQPDNKAELTTPGAPPDVTFTDFSFNEAQAAHLSAAQFVRQWGVPYRPGCEMLGCEEMWDHDLHRPFRRCHWRCPRPRPDPPVERFHSPDRPSYPPQYEASPSVPNPNVPPEIILVVVGLCALILVAGIVSAMSSTNDIDRINADATKTEDLAAKLNAAAREADDHIAAMLDKMGRNQGGSHG